MAGGFFDSWNRQSFKPSPSPSLSLQLRAPRTRFIASRWLGEANGLESATSPVEAAMIRNNNEKGATGYILAWALGVPVSLLLIVFLLRGCT
jgi:hypothetical protein